MNKYIAILIAALTSAEIQASELVPRLIVNITIDQLNTDCLDAFASLFEENGLKKIMQSGRVYETASCSFTPVTTPSSIATIATGTTPFYHGIISKHWIDRSTLRQVYCVDGNQYGYGPSHLRASTVSDEMKILTHGKSVVYSIAAGRSSAILAAGHAADNAIWYDQSQKGWKTTAYYGASPQWLNTPLAPRTINNEAIGEKAMDIVIQSRMGRDEVPDMLSVILSASIDDNEQFRNVQDASRHIYTNIDKTISKLIGGIEREVGKNNVLFVVTGTGTIDNTDNDYSLYRVPTGVFYINRTAKILNVYLNAIYGQGTYIDAAWGNQIYLNHKIIEQKRLSMHEILTRCQELLLQSSGVSDVYTSERLFSGNDNIQKILQGYYPSISGDIIIHVVPGWKLVNEDTQESYTSRSTLVQFPIIFYGVGIKAERISTPVTVDRIAPTLCKSIHIRAPNACSSVPLF